MILIEPRFLSGQLVKPMRSSALALGASQRADSASRASPSGTSLASASRPGVWDWGLGRESTRLLSGILFHFFGFWDAFRVPCAYPLLSRLVKL